MKRFLAVLLGVMVLSSATALTAFAATTSASGIEKPSRVRIEASQKWVRVGRSIQLEAAVYPDDYDYERVEWYTLDYDIVSIDELGMVTGLKPGIANIVLYVYANTATRQINVGSAEISIEVRASQTSSYVFDESEHDPDGSSGTLAARNGTIPTKTVNEAVKKALVAGTTKSATFKNYSSISTVTLESAAADMQLGGGVVLLNFDTLAVNGRTTEARLTINPRSYKRVKYDDPLQMGHSINVIAVTNDDAVKDVRRNFNTYYKNGILVVKAGQKGSYGMNVTYRVKADDTFSKAKQSELRLYAFNPDTGKFRLIKNPNISIDANKNLSFTTNTGDYLIISNGVLTKK